MLKKYFNFLGFICENKRSKKLYFIEYLLTAAAPTLCIQIGHNVVAKFGVNVVAGLEGG